MRQNTEKIIFVASNTHKYVAKGEDRNSVCCRAPHGARGLKLLIFECPARSAGRAPHGARGLKQFPPICSKKAAMSRPARGAWIETHNALSAAPSACVAPRTGRVD